jgi:hypothetical protein
MAADITNALIRCTRFDHTAQHAFELVREDLDLWVRELPENLDDIVSDLSKIRPLLKKLKTGSSDYTLHLAATVDESNSLLLPPALAELAGDCGFAIELIATPT